MSFLVLILEFWQEITIFILKNTMVPNSLEVFSSLKNVKIYTQPEKDHIFEKNNANSLGYRY